MYKIEKRKNDDNKSHTSRQLLNEYMNFMSKDSLSTG